MNLIEKIDNKINEKDEDNPQFLFQITSLKLLVMIANKKLDPVKSAKQELVNRGMDNKGKWIGHDKAQELWKV